jgi:chromate transporter
MDNAGMHGPVPAPGSASEVFGAFLRLGLTSFGGPVAHLAFFRAEFVERRRWLDDRAFGELLALAQFLPGPASSQLGFALGLQRAGWPGALAAWVAFTLPSALLMLLLALGVAQHGAGPGAGAAWSQLLIDGAIQGLKLAAVAVVAQAVWGMGRSFCPDGPRLLVALLAVLAVMFLQGLAGQLLAVLGGALAGLALSRRLEPEPDTALPAVPVTRRTGLALIGLCGLLLLVLPLLSAGTAAPAWQAAAVVYQAGALVFGGGHVVLPLLQTGLVQPGLVDEQQFLAGYGAAQALPGPLFSFAAYLGGVLVAPLGGVGWAIGLLLLVFLPGLLLMAGVLPWWHRLGRHRPVRRALNGVNAAVVGLLAAALLGPVGGAAVQGLGDALLVLLALVLLMRLRVSPPGVVALMALAGALLAAAGTPGAAAAG